MVVGLQDPVVFSGSVRANLDPFDNVEGDARIWQALEQAGLQQTISNLPVRTHAALINHLTRF